MSRNASPRGGFSFHALRLFEIVRVLVPFDYVTRVVINASDGPMWVTPTAHDCEKLIK